MNILKKILTIILTIVLVNTIVFTFPLYAMEDSHVQGHEKLPDNIEHIKNDVALDDLETIDMLEKNADRGIENNGIKREVVLNRLDDKSILEEDDNKLILIYKVRYALEEEVIERSPIVTGYRIDSEYYSYNNMTIKLSVRIDYNKDLGYQHETGSQPVKITKSTYSFDAGSEYYNNRLGVDQKDKKAKQYGTPYPSGSYIAEDYSDTKTYSGLIFSDSHVVNHSPSNYSLMKDFIAGGYIFSDGYFDVVNYVTTPPYNSWSIGTVTRSASYGAPMPASYQMNTFIN